MLRWVAAMPFDMRKTNVQASSDLRIVGSYFPELSHIARERGPLALYSGLIPTITRAFSTNAVLFLGWRWGRISLMASFGLDEFCGGGRPRAL